MQKVCETIGLFNAEYLAESDISIHTQLALLAQTAWAYNVTYIDENDDENKLA